MTDDLSRLSELKALVRELLRPSGTDDRYSRCYYCWECDPPECLARIKEILA